jgi:hypothetical protein
MRERFSKFDIIQLRCRDGRLENGSYESIDGRVNINGIPLPRSINDIQKFPSYEEIHKDTVNRKAELIRRFRLAALGGR